MFYITNPLSGSVSTIIIFKLKYPSLFFLNTISRINSCDRKKIQLCYWYSFAEGRKTFQFISPLDMLYGTFITVKIKPRHPYRTLLRVYGYGFDKRWWIDMSRIFNLINPSLSVSTRWLAVRILGQKFNTFSVMKGKHQRDFQTDSFYTFLYFVFGNAINYFTNINSMDYVV